MTEAEQIAECWREHLVASFPADCRCQAVSGIDLIHIEADTAGCVSAFLVRGGQLDPWRLAVLGLCYHHLAVVVSGLNGEARDYFSRLEKLAGLVFRTIRDATRPS
ncbi:MAG: hypothetical protein FJ304_18695 [Planctomycetes bacterium]|nr:hypothetical protein [Planctomycetota bacterium]